MLQKVNKQAQGKLEILSEIIGIIEMSRTRKVVYTCRYTSGNLIPNSVTAIGIKYPVV